MSLIAIRPPGGTSNLSAAATASALVYLAPLYAFGAESFGDKGGSSAATARKRNGLNPLRFAVECACGKDTYEYSVDPIHLDPALFCWIILAGTATVAWWLALNWLMLFNQYSSPYPMQAPLDGGASTFVMDHLTSKYLMFVLSLAIGLFALLAEAFYVNDPPNGFSCRCSLRFCSVPV